MIARLINATFIVLVAATISLTSLRAANDLGQVAYGSYGFRVGTLKGNGLIVKRDNGTISVQRFKGSGLRLRAKGKSYFTEVKLQPDHSFSLTTRDETGKLIESFVGKWRRKNNSNAILFNARNTSSKFASIGTVRARDSRLCGLDYRTATGHRTLRWSNHF